jgi:hypothetical protein
VVTAAAGDAAPSPVALVAWTAYQYGVEAETEGSVHAVAVAPVLTGVNAAPSPERRILYVSAPFGGAAHVTVTATFVAESAGAAIAPGSVSWLATGESVPPLEFVARTRYQYRVFGWRPVSCHASTFPSVAAGAAPKLAPSVDRQTS